MNMTDLLVRAVLAVVTVWFVQLVLAELSIQDNAKKIIFLVVLFLSILFLVSGNTLLFFI